MNNRFYFHMLLVVAVVGCTLSAQAWGPRVESTVVNTALHLLSREKNLPLTRLQEEVRAGAALSPVEMETLFPDMNADPIHAIENEMALLSTTRGARIDAYFAWRLGVLGKLVSRVTAPMATGDPAIRTQYYRDAESLADAGNLKPESRRTLESMEPLERSVLEANKANDLLESEYKSGSGFRGGAAARSITDISRSVNAVADVWWSVITSTTVQSSISTAQLERYVLNAYAFYVERGKENELDAADTNYQKLTSFTADMYAKIGDMLYEAGFRERAVWEYEQAVASSPERRDVVAKIANYYYESAEDKLQKGMLEEALGGFAKALSVNMLHPSAEKRRLEVAALIQKRDEQLAQYQEQLRQADDLKSLAEEEAARNHFAEAVALLKQSEDAYRVIGDEFPSEAQHRMRGLREVQSRINELQQSLLTDTQRFSGTGFAKDLERVITDYSEGLDKEILKTMLQLEYKAEIKAQTEEMSAVLRID
ncbi:MAG: hypothetical protein GX117_05820 [Candidatus Hydrogenedentes bacterium]|jgi:tetratricopeptide (TPR) repeat protein|nr:hypothetical protein [Candidatus Hydrogenedentota bacterium]